MSSSAPAPVHGSAHVPLGTGPPTPDELRVYYPPLFSWEQLKLFINCRDLGLLKRDKTLQKRYEAWTESLKEEYGSNVKYLVNYRLQWGKPDRLSCLKSQIQDERIPDEDLSHTDDGPPAYFTADIPRRFISIIMNDWPYSVPPDVEHSLIWTKCPILPSPTLLPPQIAEQLPAELQQKVTARLEQDGIAGFSGLLTPPPSPSLLPQHLAALAPWGVTMDKLVVSPKGTDAEEDAVQSAGAEVQKFVERRWPVREWETCWFVNPPRLQSIPQLAHIHVFARKKSFPEVERWDAAHSTEFGQTYRHRTSITTHMARSTGSN